MTDTYLKPIFLPVVLGMNERVSLRHTRQGQHHCPISQSYQGAMCQAAAEEQQGCYLGFFRAKSLRFLPFPAVKWVLCSVLHEEAGLRPALILSVLQT